MAAGLHYSNDLIEAVAHACVHGDEDLFRILYYDCAPYSGTVQLPVSGAAKVFLPNDGWLKELATRELFAIRRGVLKFRGYKPRRIPVATKALTDADFEPDFEQKGVDMRIGLDMATFSERRSVDRVTLITADTDCVPAMKHARIAGLQVRLIHCEKSQPPAELKWHADYVTEVQWPPGLAKSTRGKPAAKATPAVHAQTAMSAALEAAKEKTKT
jgi:uncharacterized LabA/DUF88 family protein